MARQCNVDHGRDQDQTVHPAALLPPGGMAQRQMGAHRMCEHDRLSPSRRCRPGQKGVEIVKIGLETVDVPLRRFAAKAPGQALAAPVEAPHLKATAEQLMRDLAIFLDELATPAQQDDVARGTAALPAPMRPSAATRRQRRSGGQRYRGPARSLRPACTFRCSSLLTGRRCRAIHQAITGESRMILPQKSAGPCMARRPCAFAGKLWRPSRHASS